ncbi:MAG: CoA pyrophosphatase [Saprospirales bacterium]|nr:MAG: CoA pyrophosphatase [Saprospirales bacterium]
MEYSDLPIRLSEALSGDLPGFEAHKIMGVAGHYRRQQPASDCSKAGVLALFYHLNGSWKLIFIRRSNRYQDDRHKGQIGFPGGKYEEQDENLMKTALREANEEIGVEPNRIDVLGKLSKLYIPVSNFLVHPYVGVLDGVPQFRLQPTEVDDVLTPDFHIFFDKKNMKTTDIPIDIGIYLRNVPYFDINGQVLWGATAMILSELLWVLES